jgi:hypothetical protein
LIREFHHTGEESLNTICDSAIRASQHHSHPPRRRLFSPHRQSPTATPEPYGTIPDPALNKNPEETYSEDNGLHRSILQPHTPAQESDTEEADPGETAMDEENLETKVHRTVVRTLGDDPDYIKFRHLINTSWQPFYSATDCKQAIRFVEAYYPKSQIDPHFNRGGCRISEHFSYTAG